MTSLCSVTGLAIPYRSSCLALRDLWVWKPPVPVLDANLIALLAHTGARRRERGGLTSPEDVTALQLVSQRSVPCIALLLNPGSAHLESRFPSSDLSTLPRFPTAALVTSVLVSLTYTQLPTDASIGKQAGTHYFAGPRSTTLDVLRFGKSPRSLGTRSVQVLSSSSSLMA